MKANLHVTVENMASGGHGTNEWINAPDVWQRLDKTKTSGNTNRVDYIVIETAINDQMFGEHDNMRSRTHPSKLVPKFRELVTRLIAYKIPIIFVEMFRTGNDGHCPIGPKNCSTTTCQISIPVPDDVLVNLDPYAGTACTHWWDVATLHQTILAELGVSYFSYRDFAWPALHDPPRNLHDYWHARSHPNMGPHSLVAMGVIRTFEHMCNLAFEPGAEFFRPDLSNPAGNSSSSHGAAASIDVHDIGKGATHSSGFKLKHNTIYKPNTDFGWWFNGIKTPTRNKVEFVRVLVNMQGSGVLHLAYMPSKDMCTIEVKIAPSGNSFNIPTTWNGYKIALWIKRKIQSSAKYITLTVVGTSTTCEFGFLHMYTTAT